MSSATTLTAASLIATLLLAGCAQKSQDPVDRAVDKTKDALDLREHEKLKDAGEDVNAAARDAKEGVKDAVEGK